MTKDRKAITPLYQTVFNRSFLKLTPLQNQHANKDQCQRRIDVTRTTGDTQHRPATVQLSPAMQNTQGRLKKITQVKSSNSSLFYTDWHSGERFVGQLYVGRLPRYLICYAQSTTKVPSLVYSSILSIYIYLIYMYISPVQETPTSYSWRGEKCNILHLTPSRHYQRTWASLPGTIKLLLPNRKSVFKELQIQGKCSVKILESPLESFCPSRKSCVRACACVYTIQYKFDQQVTTLPRTWSLVKSRL